MSGGFEAVVAIKRMSVGRLALGWTKGHLAGVSLAAMVAVAACLLPMGPAVAQSGADGDEPFGEGLAPFAADGPMIAVVSIGQQKLHVYDRNGVVAQSPISTGKRGHDTPEGVFSIIQREVEHNSNIYDEASMPFMQRITWSGVALHEGVVPGYKASHGCIRMPNGFAERLFRTTKIATRVVVVPNDVTPIPVSHAQLFQPGVPASASVAKPRTPEKAPAGNESDETLMMLGAQPPAEATVQLAAMPVGTQPGTMLGITELNAKRAAAEERFAVATKAANELKVQVRPKLVDLGRAEKAVRPAAALTRRAEGRIETLRRAADAARNPEARETAVTAHIDALIELAQLKGREALLKDDAAAKAKIVDDIQDQTKKAEAERTAAQNEVRSIQRRLSPVTVYVSRSTGRVYVRQAFQPVMDLPIAVREPDKPIGTHVFTAFAAKGDANGAIEWVGLTIDPAVKVASDDDGRRPSRKRQAEAVQHPAPAVAAKAALDRIELPEQVLARVMPALTPGSTLIVSDLGPSIEMGQGTDVVLLTRGEEEAKKSIANFLAKKRAEENGEYVASRRRERGRSWYDDDDDDRPRRRGGGGGWGWW